MSAAPAPPRRSYAGRGIGPLPTSRTRAAVQLPGTDAATLLPDPHQRFEQLRDAFIAANGHRPGSVPARNQPALTIRDVTAIANFTTRALRNDLPTIDPRDAAVIWEKWRLAVVQIKARLHDGAADASPVLDYRTWDLAYSLAAALVRPGEVFENYCPWRLDWATRERLHPETAP